MILGLHSSIKKRIIDNQLGGNTFFHIFKYIWEVIVINKDFVLSEEQKKKALDMIKQYFLENKEEEIGDLSAILFFDFICEAFGPYFYNVGLNDARSFLVDKIEDLYGLEK